MEANLPKIPAIDERDRMSAEFVRRAREMWQRGILSDAEYTAWFLIRLRQIFSPKKWMGSHRLSESESYLSRELSWIERPSHDQLVQFFSACRLRSISEAAHLSVLSWLQGEYSIELTEFIPEPEVLLQFQVNGVRVVSLLPELSSYFEVLHEDHDAYSLVVHDLVHAYHFFSHPDQMHGQLGFYRLMMTLQSDTTHQEAVQGDPVFAREFRYLISDMNAHALHLMSCWKAAWIGHLRRSLCQSGSRLDGAGETTLKNRMLQFAKHWEFCEETKKALLLLNSPAFQWQTHALALESTLQKRGLSQFNLNPT